MMGRVWRAGAALFLAASVLAPSGAALAQEKYPTKPIRVVVPYGPGGANDIVGRIIGESMRQTLGEPLVIDNKPGAYSIIGLQETARAKPDGYTLEIGNVNSNVITPVLRKAKLSIDAEKAIVPIARVADLPAFLIVNADFPARTFAEFIAYAKANPGKVRYSSVGVGSFPHFDMEILSRRAGVEMVHIPNNNGAGAMVKDLATGDAQAGILNVASATSMVKSGALRALAVVSEQRLPEYPDVPTLAELGFPGVGTIQWIALFAPAGVPQPIVDSLHAAAVKALDDPAVKEAFAKQTIRPSPTKSPADAKVWLASEFDRWRKIIDEVKIDLAD